MKNLLDMVSYLFLIAIPECTFITVMTLIFMRRYDFLDIKVWKSNIKWLSIPILSGALTISILTYFVKIVSVLGAKAFILVLITTIYYIVYKNTYNKINKVKTYFSIVLYVLVCGVMIAIGESFVPVFFFMLNITKETLLNNVFYMFLISLPARVLQIGIITVFITHKNNAIQEKTLHILFKNAFLRACTIIMCCTIIFGTVYCVKLICVNKILSILTLNEQLFICALLLCIPVVCSVFLYVFINYIFQKEKSIQQSYKSLLNKDNMPEV